MAWKQLEYSKNQVDKAGQRVVKDECSVDDFKNALRIVDNYRAAHGYPLYIITNKRKEDICRSSFEEIGLYYCKIKQERTYEFA